VHSYILIEVFTMICKISVEVNGQCVERPLETMNHVLNFATVTSEELGILGLPLPDCYISDYSCSVMLWKLMI